MKGVDRHHFVFCKEEFSAGVFAQLAFFQYAKCNKARSLGDCQLRTLLQPSDTPWPEAFLTLERRVRVALRISSYVEVCIDLDVFFLFASLTLVGAKCKYKPSTHDIYFFLSRTQREARYMLPFSISRRASCCFGGSLAGH